jgi:hypothetical protein
MFSLGSRSISARTTVSPPTPESNTPMGRCVRLFGFMLLVCCCGKKRIVHARQISERLPEIFVSIFR